MCYDQNTTTTPEPTLRSRSGAVVTQMIEGEGMMPLFDLTTSYVDTLVGHQPHGGANE